MKSKIFFRLAMLLVSLIFVARSMAQEPQELPPVTVTTTTNVNHAVIKSFAGMFKNASYPQWYNYDKNYLVTFIEKDQKNRALFKKNGYLIYHITYGKENNMPDDIRKIVKTNYLDYNITNAINVQQDNRNIWIVNLETDKKLIVARVEDGELEEVGNYNKSM